MGVLFLNKHQLGIIIAFIPQALWYIDFVIIDFTFCDGKSESCKMLSQGHLNLLTLRNISLSLSSFQDKLEIPIQPICQYFNNNEMNLLLHSYSIYIKFTTAVRDVIPYN